MRTEREKKVRNASADYSLCLLHCSQCWICVWDVMNNLKGQKKNSSIFFFQTMRFFVRVRIHTQSIFKSYGLYHTQTNPHMSQKRP